MAWTLTTLAPVGHQAVKIVSGERFSSFYLSSISETYLVSLRAIVPNSLRAGFRYLFFQMHPSYVCREMSPLNNSEGEVSRCTQREGPVGADIDRLATNDTQRPYINVREQPIYFGLFPLLTAL